MKTLEQAISVTPLPAPTSLDTLLSELRHLDIRLWVEGDKLRYKAAKGTLAPELLAQLRDRKAEIVEFLKAASLAADPSVATIPVIPRDGNLQLSIAQERLWYHHQFEPDSSLNNIITAYQIDGNLDLTLLDRAQHAIAQRHEILRTTFPTVNGLPTIQIAPEWSLSIPIEDFQHIPLTERDEVAHQRAIAESRRAYDLETGPLFRMRLLQLEPDKYILVLTMHRMMADGVSVDVVFRELVTYYKAYLLDRAVVLPELPIQYIDYAHWQRHRLQGEFLDRHLRYWKEHLKAPLPQLNLPISRPRPATYCFNTQRRRLIFPKQLHDALNTLSKAEEATLFMTLMAALKVLLYPYADREDVTICCSNSGRNRAEIEHAIGPFFNSLVLRTDLSGNPTFRETIAREKQVALGAFAHQDLPFEQLVPELDTSGNKGRSSLFQVFFALNPSWKDGNTLSTVELPGITFDTMFGYLYTGKTKFDLFLVAREAEEGLQLLFEYNSDLFDPEVILPIMDRFQTLLESIIADPERQISELSVLTPTEQQQLVAAAALNCESADLHHGDNSLQPISSGSIAPRTTTEQILTDIWIQVLGVETIGIYDNFFRLGGHSLLATQMILRCRQAFSIELPLRQLFELPTVADLAAAIDKLQTNESTLAEDRIIPHSGNRDNVPLSFAQQRLWFLDRLEPDSPFYNLSWAEKLQGDLNLEILQQSLDAIVVQHEILRTTYITENGSPKQSIATPRSVELSIFDLQQCSGTEREDRIQTLLQQQTQRSFNLSSDLMFRGCLIQLAPQESVLLLVMHHIATDGWSVGIFWEQLIALYTAFLNGKSNPLTALPIQYADYAVWQRAWLIGEVLDTQLNYWQQQLAGASPLLELPTDRPRPPVQTYRGARQSIALPATLTTALKQLGDREGVTLYMTLLAAFQTLLYRYSGQEDILVGSPIAGRNRTEIERLIGFFVNTLVLRTDLSGNPSFQELLMRVRGTTLDAFAHQDLPFEKLVEEINPERSLSYSPIFQVMFVFQNTPGQTSQLPGLTQTSVELTTATSQFDLTLSVEEQNGGLIGSWNYNTDLFDPDTIDRINAHFQILLAGIVANPDRLISELPLLTEKEQHQLLVEWHDPQIDYPQDKCIHQLFEQQVEKTPNAVAVVFEGQQLTYRELNHKANQLAHHLIAQGIGPEVLVGICVERSIEMIVGLLGIFKAGGAYLPLDPSYPQERLNYMLSDSQVSVLLTQQRLVEKLPEHQAQIFCLDADWNLICESSAENPNSGVRAANLAYVIYTSGSTGQPKGVLIPYQGLLNLVFWHQRTFEITAADRATQLAGMAFDASVWEIWPYLSAGASIYLGPPNILGSLHDLRDWLISQQITICFVPTPLVEGLLTLEWNERCAVRMLLTGGDTLHHYPSTVIPFGLVNNYGPTENTVVTTSCLITPNQQQDVLPVIGRPISNTQVYILDRHLQLVPIGLPGEIHIGGNSLARGYLNRPELTQERFIPNIFSDDASSRLYKTGDLARYLPDGNIEYIGRIDNQVKIRGFRIELGEIEALLAQHSGIRELAVIARADISGDKRLVAYVVPQHERPQIGELRSFLQEHLPSYMVPNFFMFLDTLPLTANGKIDRRTLPAPDLSNQESGEIFVAARDDLEQELTEIWELVLNVKPIGIQDNFFDLGGHSLLAVRLFSQIEQTFGKNLPLATLFRAPTIEQLASFLRQDKPADELWGSLVPLQTEGSKQPLFCIHGGGFNVLIYRQLAQYLLDSDRPVYGLQARGLDGESGSLADRIEDMATDYIHQIKTIQPQGPYLLSGLSNGGNIALEMAQQLQASGETVALVAMFDSYGPEGAKLLPSFPRFLSSLLYVLRYSVPRSIVQSRQSGQNVIATKLNDAIDRLLRSRETSVATEQDSVENLEYQHTSTSREHALEAMMNRVSSYILEHSPWSFFSPSAQLKDSNDSVASTLKKLEDSYSKAYKAYTPKPYQGKIVVFQAMESPPGYHIDPKLGWEQIAKDELELYKIPGNHTSIMASPILAEKMKACLDKAIDDKSTS